MISVSFAWLSVVLDFFLVLFTNSSSNIIIYVYLTLIQLPITILLSQYVAVELLLPSKKKYILSFLGLIGILFLISLFLEPINSVNAVGFPLENFYYKICLNINSLSGIFGVILIIFVFIFSGVGFIYKSFVSQKSIRNNFRYLGLGMIFISLFGLLESIIISVFLVLIRIGVIIGLFLTYWGIRPQILKKHGTYSDDIKAVSYFLHKPKSTDTLGQIEYYRKMLNRSITIFMSFYENDLKLFKIREIKQKLKEFPEINKKIYLTHEMGEDIFEFTQNMIDKFDIMLLFCTKDALNSAEVKNQWISAFENEKIIIPICVKLDLVPESLKQNEILIYDLYDFNKNMLNLRYLILRSIFIK